MGSNWEVHFKPEEILVYLRKSRSDDPLLSVEEVLEKHWAILQDWISRNLDGPVPEENIYKEVVSGETIDGRPEVLKLLKRIESPRIKGILVVEVQRLSRGDLEDCGRLIKLLRYTSTMVITPMKIYDLADEYDRDGFERELKRGNEYLEYFKKIQKRGRLQSVKSGNYIGSVPPYGYDKVFVQDSNGRKKVPTLAINETQASVVRLVYDLYVNQNMGTVNICRKLDEMGITPPKGRNWSYHTVQDMLSNEHYTGKVSGTTELLPRRWRIWRWSLPGPELRSILSLTGSIRLSLTTLLSIRHSSLRKTEGEAVLRAGKPKISFPVFFIVNAAGV